MGEPAIHIAAATDRDYAMPLAAMLASLTQRVNPDRPLVIHVLGDRLTEALWDRLVRSVGSRRVEWNRLEGNAGDLVERGFSTRSYGHISPVTYFRLLLPELLPGTLEKALYLDCDLIVGDDIAPLWDTDIDLVDLAAVPELDLAGRPVRTERWIRRYRDLEMAPEQSIFNVGVLLLNLRRWRQFRIAERAFACLRCLGPEVRWYDQDALNLVVNGCYRALEPRWNSRPLPGTMGSAPAHPVSIIHFSTATKPWHWNYRWSGRERFFESLDLTPWAGWRPRRPGWPRTRRLLERVTRVVQKGKTGVVRRSVRLEPRLRYRLAFLPRPVGPRIGEPARTPGEIRLFLVQHPPGVPSDLRRLVEAYRDAGVDRAFVLNCSGGEPPSDPVREISIHSFRCAPERADVGLRRLLDRYGVGCWCVLGLPGGVLGEDGSPVDLREWCARLDREGVDASEARTGSDPGPRVEQFGRDLRSGRLFRSTALVERPQRAWDPPSFGSRVALLKYRKTVLLDRAMVLLGNAQRSDRLLRFMTPPSSGPPSGDRRAG